MPKHRMGTLPFLLFYICAIVTAAPPQNLRAPPSESSSYSDSKPRLNLTQTAANDTLLNLLPSSPPTNYSLSSITNSSANGIFPPDPAVLPTFDGDIVIFGEYNFSLSSIDLARVIEIASIDAIHHLQQEFTPPMPPLLYYREHYTFLALEVAPHLTWTRWAWALMPIGDFQKLVGAVSFDFEVALADLSSSLGTGRVRTTE